MAWPFLVFGQAALAMLIERLIGYPDWLFRKIGHPVVWMGAVIRELDEQLNLPDVSPLRGRAVGVVALLILMALVLLPSWAISDFLSNFHYGWLIEAVLATSLIAQKSLKDHVWKVYDALGRSLPEARKAVSMIVGRDPAELDESGVSKAALESLAENTSDGIVAPVLWYVLLGLPGLALYKAINTADSMIGHKNEKYQWFGWASARLDDLVNLPASRLTALLFALTQPRNMFSILRITLRDAGKHQSPNAGWPEAAMAATLGLRFGGPRSYQGETVNLPYLGEGRDELDRSDIMRGLKLLSKAMWMLLFALLLLSFA